MKIFNKEFKTRKELKEDISRLENEAMTVKIERDNLQYELETMISDFPFLLGQKVYDIQLKNEKGKYVKENASYEHSLINVVVVDEKNYFGLVERYKRNDVFMYHEDAVIYLKSVCVK